MIFKLLNSRFYLWILAVFMLSLLFGLSFLAPVQAPVVLYKITLIIIGAILGLCFCYLAFPYARPTSYLCGNWYLKPRCGLDDEADYPVVENYKTIFIWAMVRNAIIIFGFILAISVGL